MKKVIATLSLSILLLSACGSSTAPIVISYQQDAADKIEDIRITQADLTKSFADYTVKEEKNDSRYGIGGREIFLMDGEQEVFRLRYMTFADEESLKTNLQEIGAGEDMKKAGFGDEAYKTDDRKKITFRKDGIKMDVTVLGAFFVQHDMKEIEALADLMLDKF